MTINYDTLLVLHIANTLHKLMIDIFHISRPFMASMFEKFHAQVLIVFLFSMQVQGWVAVVVFGTEAYVKLPFNCCFFMGEGYFLWKDVLLGLLHIFSGILMVYTIFNLVFICSFI